MSTRPTTRETEWTATVAVRVPQTDDGDLATAASRRLNARNEFETIDLKTIQAVEPALAATVVRLAVRVLAGCCLDGEAVRERLLDAPGVQRVDDLERV